MQHKQHENSTTLLIWKLLSQLLEELNFYMIGHLAYMVTAKNQRRGLALSQRFTHDQSLKPWLQQLQCNIKRAIFVKIKNTSAEAKVVIEVITQKYPRSSCSCSKKGLIFDITIYMIL